jgi:hypothetical protein
MSVELQVAILGILVAVVVGAWQIHLARRQVQVSQMGPAKGEDNPPASKQPPPESENLLHRLWGRFDPELQAALALAYNQARREGKNRISTRTFFAAVARLKPGWLAQLLGRLPEGSLPEPIGEDVPPESSILQEDPQLSTCVENALTHLAGKADPRHPLSTAEVFVDVAKHGAGASVARLREEGVTPERIDQLVGELGWEVRER